MVNKSTCVSIALPRFVIMVLLLTFLFMLMLLAIMVRRGAHQADALASAQALVTQSQKDPNFREAPTTIVRTLGEIPVLESPPPLRIAIDQNAASSAPGTYPQLGYLKPISGSNVSGILPIYGRPSVARNGRVFYYTIISNSGIKVPLHSTTRDCMEDVGCEELSSGDSVTVPDAASAAGLPQETQWAVVIYKYNRL